MTPEHLELIEEVSGPDWPTPSTALYTSAYGCVDLALARTLLEHGAIRWNDDRSRSGQGAGRPLQTSASATNVEGAAP
jgi:hypothetical protein